MNTKSHQMAEIKHKLGLMLSTPPDHPNLPVLAGLARAALSRGDGVYLYLIDEGVRALDDLRIQELARGGVKLFACAYGAKKHHLPTDNPLATYCGLVVLNDLIDGCDRFLAFN
ncbi:MAG TPA: DsrE family protein [Nitrospiria bacterium]|nr:DsrE family protein [Nitrospiria bacterium]